MDISYSALKQNLKSVIDKAIATHKPFFIASHKVRKAVILSYEDYQSLAETAYLLKNPIMAKRLLDAVTAVKNGKVMMHSLINEI